MDDIVTAYLNTWNSTDGAEPVVIGFDVVVLDEDGRIDEVRGFLDKVLA